MQTTQLKLLDENHILIQSETFGEINYIITMDGLNAIACTCKDYEFRLHKQKNYHCKHMVHISNLFKF